MRAREASRFDFPHGLTECLPSGAIKPLGFKEFPFPIQIRISDLQNHRSANKGRKGAPAIATDPDWLVHFLASQWDKEDSQPLVTMKNC